jgi:hypothetical protein
MLSSFHISFTFHIIYMMWLPHSFFHHDRTTDTQTETAANLYYAHRQLDVRVKFSDITQTD